MTTPTLQNEIAIVSGADSGIGQASAIALARQGADVAVLYHSDREGADKTVAAIQACGRKAVTLQLDQTDSAAVDRMFGQVRQQLGLPTILVNNAGINANGVPVKDLSDEDWDKTIRTNLYGPFYCCRAFIRGLDGSGRHGSIINITSVHQEIPMPGASAYDASKGGLRNLTTTLALEVSEKNINVNNVAPGMILTPMNQAAIDDASVREKQVQSIPMKRAGTPEEVAHVVAFLASPQARYIQGATIVVDGALMLFQGQGA
ncbi:3-oxoacyl-ACP reductase FabG [Cupriavidus respiraculi]|uniref:SDR family NAD(P)-dependent oxidoreductase n=1 Tax=Cupriavidus respiraculi TaxID=195930 RepID=UPI001C978915|nr:3-oxoacyl-ACP reductase FabG [Cupriavidus respiraculi]MBY4947679.1 3-oxoacyl-ACP reductase FabG [Cupriavidus respiraculi]